MYFAPLALFIPPWNLFIAHHSLYFSPRARAIDSRFTIFSLPSQEENHHDRVRPISVVRGGSRRDGVGLPAKQVANGTAKRWSRRRRRRRRRPSILRPIPRPTTTSSTSSAVVVVVVAPRGRGGRRRGERWKEEESRKIRHRERRRRRRR
jgi:hypothetical protein